MNRSHRKTELTNIRWGIQQLSLNNEQNQEKEGTRTENTLPALLTNRTSGHFTQCIIDQNLKPRRVKLPNENIGEILCGLGLSVLFLNTTLKS